MIRKLAAVLVSVLIIVSFAACGISGGTSTATTNPTPAKPSASTSGTTFTGRVTSVSGNTITLDVLARSNQQNGRQQNGNNTKSTDVTPNAATSPTGSSPPGGPSGGSSQHNGNGGGQQFNGNRPNGGGGFNLTPTGESKTISVTSGTSITIGGRGSSSVGTISDIKAGDILSVTMDGDAVKSIVISNYNFSTGQQGGQNQDHPQSVGQQAGSQSGTESA